MNNFEKLKLDNQLCFPLYALSREIIKLYKPLLSKHNLTYTQYVAMLVLWEEEKIDFKSLGKRLHLDSGTLTPVLKKLVSMDYVNKYRSPHDDRQVIVEVTQKGLLLKEQIVDVPDQLLGDYKGDIEDLIMLKKYLDKVLCSMNED
ncbi:MarR family winged helix-turn-helix transcriptional regulator [Fusibacter sp. JL216-2]|uniref:MarR family winged helix-turn-helix transcriptional regulator n=1 Tax=Fusibacter sp. JL216-2 TaxID=3071453 RepID=UPI003D3334DC